MKTQTCPLICLTGKITSGTRKKDNIFCATLPFVEGNRLRIVDTPYKLIYLPSKETQIPLH